MADLDGGTLDRLACELARCRLDPGRTAEVDRFLIAVPPLRARVFAVYSVTHRRELARWLRRRSLTDVLAWVTEADEAVARRIWRRIAAPEHPDGVRPTVRVRGDAEFAALSAAERRAVVGDLVHRLVGGTVPGATMVFLRRHPAIRADVITALADLRQASPELRPAVDAVAAAYPELWAELQARRRR